MIIFHFQGTANNHTQLMEKLTHLDVLIIKQFFCCCGFSQGYDSASSNFIVRKVLVTIALPKMKR